MMVPESPAARIARAKSYPFGPPTESYLFRAGRAEPLTDAPARVRGLTPVLASGSNAAPDQLARKYAAHGATVAEPPSPGVAAPGAAVAIPVTRARVRDFDSVYNAHIAAYGSVPATLFPSPGTVLTTFITWLDDEALAVMHGTEQPGVNYHYAELSGIAVEVEGLGVLDAAFAYISVAGCLIRDGAPVALAEVSAAGRTYPALTQIEALTHARDLTAPDMDIDAFILDTIADEAQRLARGRALAVTARAFAHPGFRVIPLGG
jgi:hypothetical protein